MNLHPFENCRREGLSGHGTGQASGPGGTVFAVLTAKSFSPALALPGCLKRVVVVFAPGGRAETGKEATGKGAASRCHDDARRA
ncbi:hypothetical protein [Pectobacterium aroidearum]|uniref:hypothetical protein n=1 Tax=Pectobacterium aroidearum TaxID=1201031 RepID=UPI0030160ABF